MWDRKGQFVSNIVPKQVPRQIQLLLDTSGSMGVPKSPNWSNVARIAIQFALQRKGEDLIALDTFAERDESQVPMTADSKVVAGKIETIGNSGMGRTMLGLALREILARRENRLRFGDAIILVSDGERSDADKTDFSQLRDDLIRHGVRICLIRVQPVMGFGATQEATDVSKLVAETGGLVLNASGPLPQPQVRLDAEAIVSIVKDAYAFVRTYYRITLETSEILRAPRQLRLELSTQNGEKIKGLRLNYPRYFLPSSQN